MLANEFQSCCKIQGFPLDYSLIVVGPLRRRLSANPSLTAGGVMLSVTIQYNSHTFASFSLVSHVFRVRTEAFKYNTLDLGFSTIPLFM